MSLKNFFVQQLKDKDVPESESKLVMQMAEMWGAFVGSPWERQSLKFFWLEECIDGGKPDDSLGPEEPLAGSEFAAYCGRRLR